MHSGLKNEVSASNFEITSTDNHSKSRIYAKLDNARIAVTSLALVAAIVILGVSAHSLAVYEQTHLPSDFLLPLWPKEFDIRPTNALIAGGVIVLVVNAVSLLTSKSQSLRARKATHTSVSLAAPVVGFIATIVAVGLYYTVNASTTTDSMQSWTCRWKNVGMMTQPYFGTLCQESEAALALSILLIPLEVIVLALAGYQVSLEKKLGSAQQSYYPKGASPAMS